MPANTSVEARRLLVFGIVGSLNTAICYSLFAVLVHWCAWHHHAALVADYAFGIVLGYVLHRVSTFADRRDVRQAFGKYTITLVATFAANLALLDALVRCGWLEPLAAQGIAMIAVTLGSYLAQKNWVFRSYAKDGTMLGPAPSANPAPTSAGQIVEPQRRAA